MRDELVVDQNNLLAGDRAAFHGVKGIGYLVERPAFPDYRLQEERRAETRGRLVEATEFAGPHPNNGASPRHRQVRLQHAKFTAGKSGHQKTACPGDTFEALLKEFPADRIKDYVYPAPFSNFLNARWKILTMIVDEIVCAACFRNSQLFIRALPSVTVA